jgi:hypothetical protein
LSPGLGANSFSGGLRTILIKFPVQITGKLHRTIEEAAKGKVKQLT